MTKCFSRIQVPHGLGVRISDFHSDGPGSIPGVGVVLTIFKANPPYLKNLMKIFCTSNLNLLWIFVLNDKSLSHRKNSCRLNLKKSPKILPHRESNPGRRSENPKS